MIRTPFLKLPMVCIGLFFITTASFSEIVHAVSGNKLFRVASQTTPQRNDIVISELMADPTPAIGLPELEWVELHNTSNTAINLLGWRVGDARTVSGPMPNFILQPDSMVLVCASSSATALSTFARVVAVTSFPSLDNDGDVLFIRSAQGNIIHAVEYTADWYQNDMKANGGWSLEMIDVYNPCSGISNWIASSSLIGATPGKINAATRILSDRQAPQLLRAFAVDSLTIHLVFNEPLDSARSIALQNFNVDNGIGQPIKVNVIPPIFSRVQLKLSTPLQRNKIYRLQCSGVADCVGNSVAATQSVKVGLSSFASRGDVIVNEILFNPPANGTDYVELYNKSNHIINLSTLSIANRNTVGNISSIEPLTNEPMLLFPESFVLLAESFQWIKQTYSIFDSTTFVSTTLPTLSDDKGNVLLLNEQGTIIDELNYTQAWHFPFIQNEEGVALERINYFAPTQAPENWHSASTTVQHGTPGYQNSQHRINDNFEGTMKWSTPVLTPDNDGVDDFGLLQYVLPEAGYVAAINIYDQMGRVVKVLQQAALCGREGSFRWDGIGEKGQKLKTGIYIIYVELFKVNGKRKSFKIPIVLATSKQ
ncbi:MAG: lamin tail domain-containing protein [Ferruginibacter sp.]